MTAEVESGYKQTGVWVIPEDWDFPTMGEICVKIQDGTHFSPKSGGSDYLYITSKNIRFGYLDITSASLINREQHQSIYRRCDVKKGDLLFTKDGANTGNAALNTLDEEFSLLSSVAFLRFHERKHSAGYFLQQFLSHSGQRRIQDAMAGNAITRLTLDKINKLRFPVPPTKAEQEAIAEALSDADALIESLEQLIAKKRQIKRGAMQELLTGKKRLPGFSGEWEVKLLGDVVKITKGQLITEENAISGDIPVIAGGKKPAYFHNKPNRTGKTITISASGASAGYVAIFNEPIFASDCSTISEGRDYSIEFIYSQLQLKQDIIFKSQTGGAQPHVHAVDLMPIEIGIPSLPEQNTIAIILSEMDEEVVSLEAKLAKAHHLKQGMMHNLLTGKIRMV